MPKLTYFPLLMDRWVAGTRELTFEQKGFYIDLLVYLYDSGKPIKDADHAARITGCDPRTSRRLLADLSQKFYRRSDGLRHKLVSEILKKGGRIKTLGTFENLTEQRSDPDPDPDPEVRKEPPSYNSPPVGARFEDWWKCYPRKVGKKPCRAIWVRRKLDDKADELIADVKNRRTNDFRWLGGFVPNPATYLNQDRWQDEIQQDTQETPFERTERKLQQWVDERPDGEVLAGDGQPVRPTVVPLLR